MAGKRQKHPESLAFKRGGRYRALPLAIQGGERLAPACPDGVGKEARVAWDRVWESSLRQAIADSDLPALYRWIWWLDQWVTTAKEVVGKGPTVRGTRGEEVPHAKVRYLRACEASLQKLEEEFGMTPLARDEAGTHLQ